MPAVSVITPVYNRPLQLQEAVISVLKQTLTDLEIIVVDDGSTDDLPALVSALSEPRVRYLRQSNAGAAMARNAGLKAANGDFIAFLDSDDVLIPNGLERLHAQLQCDAGAAIGHGWAVTVDSEERAAQMTRPKLQGMAFRQLLFSNPIPIGTLMLRRGCLANGEAFDPELALLEDWDLWLRLSFRHAFTFVPAVVARLHSQPIRRQTSQPASRVIEVVRKIYAKALDDPAAPPYVGAVWPQLQANVHVMAGQHSRVFEGDLNYARREFLTALRIAPTFAPAYVGLAEAVLGQKITNRMRAIRSRLYANSGVPRAPTGTGSRL